MFHMFQVIYAQEWMNDAHDHEMQVQSGKTNTRGVTETFSTCVKFQSKQRLRASAHRSLWANYSKKHRGASYFLLVVDDYSRYMWVEMLRSKDQALESFKKVIARAENESGAKLKALRTDRGGEFTSNLFSVFCSEGGIKHYTTTPYTPQQNGVVERRNQSVVEMPRCLLKTMKVPSVFWGEAVRTAVYLLNRSPTKALNNITPFEAWHGVKPKVSHLKIFGCVAHVKLVGPGISKLSDRSRRTVFIG